MPQSRVEQLRVRATELLERSKYPMEAEELLERILLLSGGEDSEHARFAHFRLAEILLESNPWRAALHAKRVVASEPDDHAAHALLGLAHGLLRNYRLAVRSFERAASLAPGVSAYHHNLGHFLAEGLGEAKEALPSLRMASSLSPDNAEILASYGLALARAGDLQTGALLARRASRLDPKSSAHRELVRWIEGQNLEHSGQDTEWEEVRQRLRLGDDEEHAVSLLERFATTKTKWTNAAALAAAIDYLSGPAATQREVAARHGVGVSTLSKRVKQVRSALDLDY